MTLSVPGRGGGGKRGDLGRFQQGRELLELLGVGGAVLLDRSGERLLVGVDDLLLVAGLDGEVDPGQVAGLRAVGVRDGRGDLRPLSRRADRHSETYLP